jgi:hypothetical protein
VSAVSQGIRGILTAIANDNPQALTKVRGISVQIQFRSAKLSEFAAD